jgi:hypothetical protein
LIAKLIILTAKNKTRKKIHPAIPKNRLQIKTQTNNTTTKHIISRIIYSQTAEEHWDKSRRRKN